jgi:hypothetical protein
LDVFSVPEEEILKVPPEFVNPPLAFKVPSEPSITAPEFAHEPWTFNISEVPPIASILPLLLVKVPPTLTMLPAPGVVIVKVPKLPRSPKTFKDVAFRIDRLLLRKLPCTTTVL